MGITCSSPSEKKLNEDTTVIIPIEAKHEDDLKAAKHLIENFPDLKESFELFDSMAVEISKVVQSGEVEQSIDHLVRLVKMSYFDFSKQEEQEALSEYLARINMTQLLYDLYDLLMKKVGIEYFTESIHNQNKNAPAAMALFHIRNMLLNYSDGSLLFGEYLAETGFFKFCIQDLEAMKDDISEPQKKRDIFVTALGTIHNCARSPATRQIFHSLDTVTYIIPFLKCDSPRVKIIVLLTLAYIISEDQNHLLMAEKELYEILLRYIKHAWKNTNHQHDVFHLNALVAGMQGLVKNDKNKKLLIEIGALPVLVEILKHGTDAEKKPAIHCIRELSSDTENRTIILKDEEVMRVLKSLCVSQNKNISKAADDALLALGVTKEDRKREDDEKKKHVMLSYAWAEQKKVLEIKRALKRANFKVWMDVDNMSGSTAQAMAEAVEKAGVVLMCMSDSYKKSQNCRLEAEYAVQQKKDIIPLIMKPGYQPDEWLGIILGTKLSFDFSDRYPFQSKIKELIKELESRGKALQAELPT